MKFKKLNIAFIVVVFVGVIAYVIYADGPDTLLNMFRTIRPFWLSCAVIMMLLYWLLEGLILNGVTKPFHPEQKFRHSLRTSMIGQLFNCLTPFSSGGQPVQAYDMVKSGVPLGIAGSALMIKFIIYQVALTVYSAVVLIFFWQPFSALVSSFGWLVFIGFLINSLVMLGLLSVCFFRKFTRKLAELLIRLLSKIRLVKDREKTMDYMDNELNQFHESFLAIRQHWGRMFCQLLLSFVQLTVFFLIPYFILLSFNIVNLPVMMSISAQAFVVMISSFVPLPGAAGGAEFSFHTFFAPFFPEGFSVNLAMLLWRMITFYLPILVGTLFMMSSSKAKVQESSKTIEAA